MIYNTVVKVVKVVRELLVQVLFLFLFKTQGFPEPP